MPGSGIRNPAAAADALSPTATKAAGYAGLSLFLSGAACLLSQVVIQKYLSVLFGGMAAPIMYLISFSFIAGLGAGSLLAGSRAARWQRSQVAWFRVNLACAGLVAVFIPIVTRLHDTAFPRLADAGAFDRIEWYYAYVLLIQFFTSFLLATVMGMNYPIAFETLLRSTAWERRNIAIFVLVTNTAGAAFGSIAAERISKWTTLLVLLEGAAAVYLASAFLPLLISRSAARDDSVAPHRPPVASRLEVQQGCFLLFIGGFVGFACESLYFRHYGMLYPFSHSVFGIVLCIYLVLWSAGVLVASFRILASPAVFCGFFVSSAMAGFLMLFSPALTAEVRLPFLAPLSPVSVLITGVFFLPAFFSGWFYSQVHNEMTQLDSRNVARLYFANLSGSFVGGVTAGYVFPTVSYAVYAFVALLAAMVLASISYQRAKLAVALGAGLIVWCLLVFVPQAPPHIRYYRALPMNAEGDIDVAEDWTTACWVNNRTFYVGGKSETPNFHERYGGLRLHQVPLVACLRQTKRIGYIGLGLGVANGRLGVLLPNSRIDHIDYSPVVARFVEKYAEYNDDVAHQPNSAIILRDGRLALMLSREQFDVIIEIALLDRFRGSSAIKSVEFLQLVKSRLRPAGIYIAATAGRFGIAAVQKVFSNVYVFAVDAGNGELQPEGVTIIVATDSPLGELLEPAGLDSARLKDPELESALKRKVRKSLLVKVKPIQGRYVRDIDPCADYFSLWEAVETEDLDLNDVVSLPF